MAAIKDRAGKTLKIGDPVLLQYESAKVTGFTDDGKAICKTDQAMFPGGPGKTELTLPADAVTKWSPPGA